MAIVLSKDARTCAITSIERYFLEENGEPIGNMAAGALLAFFLAEMGDKTQIATVALAAQYHVFFSVVAGTTLGMMIANAPAVLAGQALADRLPLKLIRTLAALAFAATGLWILIWG